MLLIGTKLNSKHSWHGSPGTSLLTLLHQHMIGFFLGDTKVYRVPLNHLICFMVLTECQSFTILFLQDIVLNTLKCIGIFYIIYYCIGSLVFGIFKLQHFDGKIPFDFNMWVDYQECCQIYSAEKLGMYWGCKSTTIRNNTLEMLWWGIYLNCLIMQTAFPACIIFDFYICNISLIFKKVLNCSIQICAADNICNQPDRYYIL